MTNSRLLHKTLTTAAICLTLSACSFAGKAKPADYPLPIYPGAVVPPDAYRDMMGARTLTIDSTDNSEKIVDYYRAALEEDGWQNVKVVQSGAIRMMSASRTNAATKVIEAASVQVQPTHIVLAYVKQ